MKKTIGLFTIIFITVGMIACAKKDSNKVNNSSPAVVPVNPAVVANTGPVAYFMQSKPSTISNQSSFNVSGQYREVLKNFLGVCDRTGVTLGYPDCSNWIGGFHLVRLAFQSQSSNQPSFTAFSLPSPMTSGFSFNFSFGFDNGSAYLNPFIPTGATINPINTNQGFEIRVQGSGFTTGYNDVLIMRINNGKLGDAYLNVQLIVRNENQADNMVGSGTMYICPSNTCGLPF